MGRCDNQEVETSFRRLVEAAETFVSRAPKQKRIETERSVLLDAISHAQLVLSVSRVSKDRPKASSTTVQSQKQNARLEREFLQSQEKVKQLELRLETMTAEREAVQEKVERAKGLLESASNQRAVIPFKRVR